MAESSTLTILRNKVVEIENTIATYEREIESARKNLVAVGMTLALFQCENGAPAYTAAPMSLSKLFRRGELPKMVFEALAAHPDGQDTRELAVMCLAAKGFDTTNAVLRRSMAMKLVNTLDKLRIKGRMEKAGMRNGVIVWRVP